MALVRTSEGVYAVHDMCSHAAVPLSDGDVVGNTIECWMHGSAFDLLSGRPLTPPAVQAVPVYPTRLVGEGDDQIVEVCLVPTDPSSAEEMP
jgi:3-phenylpropionate/trans-cinnamate dioxygenase ferredoxin subunit